MGKKKIDVMITAFRDGFQSVYGARVITEDFLPALAAASEAGLDHFEVGGGARFQSLYFYCNEDAFDMMEACRKTTGKEANLQTLARGINVVGLESQSSDIIKLHAELFYKHGITTIRNFDALNDVDNLDYSGRCIVDAGLKHEICVTLMALPPGVKGAHTPEFYVMVVKNILDAGIPFDSFCFKDASGTAPPNIVYNTIKEARAVLPKETPIRFHTHETAGISITGYKAALDAGAEAIDLSMAPVSGGTGQPDIVVMWHALRGTDFDLGVDINKVLRAEEIFKERMKDYFLPPEAARVEPMIPFSPMPGGALTANTQMMRDNNILDRFPEIIAAMGEVVERGGFGTSVTPVSQFYFQQAFNNVLFGPWKKIAEGYGKMVLGYFGKTPTAPDPEIVQLSQEQLGLEPTQKSARLINDEDPTKGVEPAKKRLQAADLPQTDENIFISATCGEKGIAYLKGEAKVNVRKRAPEKPEEDKQGYTVSVNGREYAVLIEGNQAIVNGKSYDVEVKEGIDTGRLPQGAPATPTQAAESAPQKAPAATSAPKAQKAPVSGGVSVTAPMPGTIVRITADVGKKVKSGETIVVLEAMKMETEVKSPKDGTIASIEVAEGDQVSADQVIARLN
jgi:pyruvate carboxylase subunit B